MTARIPDLNGWYEVPENPLSRVGVFPYSGRSIGAPADQADKIFMVYRPEEELSDPATLASFRLLPWTNDHTMLGDPGTDPNLMPVEEKGAHGVIGEQVYYDPNDRTLRGNVKVWSKKLAALIDGGKKELSLGFRCVYEFVSGNFEGQHYDAIQRTIRGNHMATVQQGRMGPGVAVLDHAKFTFDAKELIPMAVKTTRRALFAKKLKLSTADAATFLTGTAMDAEVDAESDGDEGDGGGDMTLAEVTAMLKAIAPQIAGLTSAMAAMGGGGTGENPESLDDMEPMLDAAGQAVMDPTTGKPKMQKKVVPAVAPAADAVPPALAAMDAMVSGLRRSVASARAALPANTVVPAFIVAMDNDLSAAERKLAEMRRAIPDPTVTAMDARLKALETKTPAVAVAAPTMKDALKEIGARDRLAARVSHVVGAFDHSEMTLAEVATYANGKLSLGAPAGSELVAVESYLKAAATPVAPRAAFALDGAGSGTVSKISDYMTGKSAAK